MKKRMLLTLAISILAGCTPTAYKITPIPLSDKLGETAVAADYGLSLPKIALVDIDGVIENARESTLFGTGDNPTALTVEKLRKAAEDPRVKAVVLRINSPGGGVTASDIIYRQVLKLKNGDPVRRTPPKPVVVAMLDTCASGGYYIACAATEIHAEPTTVTGSIGVIMLTYNAKGLLDKVGVATDAIKSGPRKDAGSPFRPLDPAERELFQSMINEFYCRFVDIVAESRPKLGRAKVKALADGRVYTGLQACKLGLIDRTDGLDGAIQSAKDLAGISAARIVMYHRPEGYRGNIYSAAPPALAPKAETPIFNLNVGNLVPPQGAFLYLWQP